MYGPDNAPLSGDELTLACKASDDDIYKVMLYMNTERNTDPVNHPQQAIFGRQSPQTPRLILPSNCCLLRNKILIHTR